MTGVLHSSLVPPPKVGRDSRSDVVGDLGPGGPWGCRSPYSPRLGALEYKGVHRMWLPICPPPISAAHASARSQTSKNVKHVAPVVGGGV